MDVSLLPPSALTGDAADGVAITKGQDMALCRAFAQRSLGKGVVRVSMHHPRVVGILQLLNSKTWHSAGPLKFAQAFASRIDSRDQ